MESASTGARYLDESVRFWDSVAEATEEGPRTGAGGR